MKATLTLLFYLFTYSISAQSILFVPGQSGWVFEGNYSKPLSNALYAAPKFGVGSNYIFNGRASIGFSFSTEIFNNPSQSFIPNFFPVVGDRTSFLLRKKIIEPTISYLLIRQDAENTILSFSLDASYQYINHKYAYDIHGVHTSIGCFGASVYRKFPLGSRLFLIPFFSTSFGLANFKQNELHFYSKYKLVHYELGALYKTNYWFIKPSVNLLSEYKYGADDHFSISITGGFYFSSKRKWIHQPFKQII